MDRLAKEARSIFTLYYAMHFKPYGKLIKFKIIDQT